MAENNRRKHKRRKRRGAGIYLIFAVIVLAAAVFAAVALFFRVENVEVSGCERYTPEQIIEASGAKKGENILTLDAAVASKAVYDALPYIKEAQVRKGYPNRLYIDVEEAAPAAVTAAEGAYWLISSEGRLLEQISRQSISEYLLVSGLEASEPSEGALVKLPEGEEDKITKLAALLTSLEENEILSKVSSVDFSKSYELRFTYAGKYEVVLGEPTDIDYKVRYLIYVADWLASQGDTRKGTIDLSYNGGEAHFFPD